jgi:hypothetical protein
MIAQSPCKFLHNILTGFVRILLPLHPLSKDCQNIHAKRLRGDFLAGIPCKIAKGLWEETFCKQFPQAIVAKTFCKKKPRRICVGS